MTVTAAPRLLRWLAAPLLAGVVTLGVWMIGDSPSARLRNAELLWRVAGPLLITGAAIKLVRSGSDRALVLPTPLLLALIFSAQRGSTVPTLAILVANSAAMVLLYACWQVRRALAQWAATCCCGAVIWMHIGTSW